MSEVSEGTGLLASALIVVLQAVLLLCILNSCKFDVVGFNELNIKGAPDNARSEHWNVSGNMLRFQVRIKCFLSAPALNRDDNVIVDKNSYCSQSNSCGMYSF